MKVLIASDGSKNAEYAAAFFTRLPLKSPFEVTLATVSGIRVVPSSLVLDESIRPAVELPKAVLDASLSRSTALLTNDKIQLKSVQLDGHAAEQLVEYAKTNDIDLIVIGAVGHSMKARMGLGNISDFVATQASCSVLVVRSPASPSPSSASQPPHICVAYDDCVPSKNALKELRAFDWDTDTRIDLVNVIASPYVFTDVPIRIDTLPFRNAATKLLSNGASEAKRLGGTIQSELIESDHVGEGIVQYADTQGCDLIVMGDTGHGMLRRFFMGSTSRYVLRNSGTSVWISRLVG